MTQFSLKEKEIEKTCSQYVNNINYSPELHFEAIKVSQDWFNADIETWHLCAACSRAYDQESFDSVWSTIPGGLLKSIVSGAKPAIIVSASQFRILGIDCFYSVDNSLVTSSDNEQKQQGYFVAF